MANILPEQKRKRIRQDYLLRILAVVFFLVSVALFLGSALLLPASVMSLSYRSVVEGEYEASQKREEGTEYRDAKSIVDDINKMVDTAKRVPETHYVDFINTVISTKDKIGSSINIVSIFSGNRSKDGQIVHVTGTVANRELLTEFVRELKQVEMFKSVKVPISDFAKKDSMTFSIAITI